MHISCSGRLKTETALAHEQTEKVMMPMLGSITNIEAYINVLKMMYGFYKPLEEIITQYIKASILDDIDQRHKSNLARADVNYFGNANGFITASKLPGISNLIQAFGAMYVLEGSTLGGVYISKMIRKNNMLPHNVPVSFFESYGSEVGSMWKHFKEVMDKIVINQNDIDEAVYIASETFESMQQWMTSFKDYKINMVQFSRC